MLRLATPKHQNRVKTRGFLKSISQNARGVLPNFAKVTKTRGFLTSISQNARGVLPNFAKVSKTRGSLMDVLARYSYGSSKHEIDKVTQRIPKSFWVQGCRLR